MSARKVSCFLFLVMLMAALPVFASSPTIVTDVEVTGAFFNRITRSTVLCAQVTPADPDVTVRFTGVRPDGITATAGPVLTDIFGRACISVDWWQGVYTVTARACSQQTPSPPVAVLVYIPDFCGAVGGGLLELFCCGVPPNVQRSIEPRFASFAFAYETYPKRYFSALYYDNDCPLGAICFMATSYRTVEFSFNGCNQVKLTGYGLLTQGNNPPRYVSYTIWGIDCLGDYNDFRIQLRDFAGQLIYNSSPCPNNSNGSSHLVGDVIVRPCPAGMAPPRR